MALGLPLPVCLQLPLCTCTQPSLFPHCTASLPPAGDDELYQAQRPLPLAELHPGGPTGNGGGGVLALLKLALWHVLWVEAAPSPGGWPPEAAALRAQLKEAAGQLMGQLHDRNCRHAFAPAQAFQAEALPADRFQSEMQAGAAAGRALGEADAGSGGGAGAGRAWGLLAHAPFLVPFRERARLFQALVAQVRGVGVRAGCTAGVLRRLAGAGTAWPGTRAFFATRSLCTLPPTYRLTRPQERGRHRDMDLMSELGGNGNRFFAIRRTQARGGLGGRAGG